MNDVKSYADPLQIGDVMTGESTGVVIKSTSDKFVVGDHVAVHQGWQSYISV
jgi:NADPH-dependent curcumin reductase CurA